MGVLSFLLVDLSPILRNMPANGAARFSPFALKLLSPIQPTILLCAATLVGVLLAPKVGLSAPAFEALARHDSFIKALRPQIIPGLIGGFVGGVAIVVVALLAKPSLPAELMTRVEELNRSIPLPTRLLYGGITEELLLRWGVLTFLVWVGWRLFQRGQGKPGTAFFVIAIVISSIIFGLGHLPLAVALGARITIGLVLYIVVLNSVFGLIAGYLFWRKGLEAAIMAHMMAHVVLVSASYLVR